MVADASGAFCHLVHRPNALPAKQRCIVGKFSELPALPRVSARAIVAGRSAQGNSARTTSRPLQALKAFYPSERRPKSGTLIQGRELRVRQVQKAPARA
jgi:hypothetical protein